MSIFNIKQLQVYFIGGTQDIHGNEFAFLNQLELACQNGITMFQYREKGPNSLTGEKKIQLAKKVHKLTDKYNIPLIIDDDLKLAKQIQVDGIHVGQTDEKIQKVIKDSPEMIIGLSVHDPDEINQSGNLDHVNYLGVGPIYPTSSKADAKQPIGTTGLSKIISITNKPIVAIGGISTQNVNAVLETKVNGIATISAIMKSQNLAKTINELKGKNNVKN